MIIHAKQVICNAVIARIHHDENIIAPDGLLHQTLRVTALETGTGTLLFVIVWMTPMQKLTG